jgi:hypothetical protein
MFWRVLAWRYGRMAGTLEREAARLRGEGYAGLAIPTGRLAAEYRVKARTYDAAASRRPR